MNISIVPISRIFKTYQGQARIAELNSKNPVKRVQTQRDRVSISQEARAALATQGASPKPEAQIEGTPTVQNEVSTTPASVDENFSQTNFAE
jgi:hypothetical protein